jgi:hypothetical protein
MQVDNIPFKSFGQGIYRPCLKVRVINPHTKKHYDTWAIVDTGADNCIVPSVIGRAIGHTIDGVRPSTSQGIGGSTDIFNHTTRFEIYHPTEETLLYRAREILAGYTENVPVVLLGPCGFLEYITLIVDYPSKTFSMSSSIIT